MSIPKYYEMNKPFLEYLRDEHCHTLKEIKKYLSVYFKLSQEELLELLSSGTPVFSNRVSWASLYLKKAGLIVSPARATFTITKRGLSVLVENPKVIDNNYLMRFDEFRQFQKISSYSKNKQTTIIDTQDTPDDIFEEAFQKINSRLQDDLLSEVMKLSPISFEQMVLDLLSKMGYGEFENAIKKTSATADGGIDGIIMEDKLGFDLIYLQAKKWDLSSTVDRPDIQKFVGAIAGKGGKGLFVTTAKYSRQAIEYANNQHIILIDGKKLVQLMIEYNFGVNIRKAFEIKMVDTDLFNSYLEE